jgi:hypothetical protein
MSDRFPSQCPEAIMHGPADRAGRCPWCGRREDEALPRTKTPGEAEIEHRYLMGLRS